MFINEKHHESCVSGCIQCIVTLRTDSALPRKQAYDYLMQFPINSQNDIENIKVENDLRINKNKKTIERSKLSDLKNK